MTRAGGRITSAPQDAGPGGRGARVADRDEAVATALSLGARDMSGPIDNAWTKSAIVRDPQGATFTLSQFDPQS